MNSEYENLAALDKTYIWHPFTQMQDYLKSSPVIIERGDGVKLIDVRGRSFYDGVSSIWLNIHGHRVPLIDHAIREQLNRIAHSTSLGLANVPAIRLAQRLVEITPERLTKVFYSDDGSTAVEIGLKIAYQYWRLKGKDTRKSFIAMTSAYHGDTIGATSVGGIDLFHATYRDLLFHTFRVPYPYPYRFRGSVDECAADCLAKLEETLSRHHHQVAGLIVEPMVQGAAGMVMMPEGFMKRVEQLCRSFAVLLLVDEVATGFGRTGELFACEHEGIQPDIMMVAKGITGGYLPLAATLTSDEIYSAFLGEYREKKTFFHGHSYTGNQLCCAAALANIALLTDDAFLPEVRRKTNLLAELAAPIGDCPHVGEVRQKGFMIGFELVHDKANRKAYSWEEQIGVVVCERCRQLGMIVRPLGHVVVFMPPLASSDDDLRAMTGILCQAIQDVTDGG